MKERMISAVAGLLMAGMAALFGFGAYVSHGSYQRELDYDSWVKTPGRLRVLEIHQTLHRMRWQYVVSCEYEFEYGGNTYLGRGFDLKGVVYPTLEHARAGIEAELRMAGRARWRQVRTRSADDWALDARDIQVTVRHSPRNPSVSTLTGTPPMSTVLNWVVILVLGALAAVTGLGGIALLVVSCRPVDVGPEES